MVVSILWAVSIISLLLVIVVDIYKIYYIKKSVKSIEKIRDELKETLSTEMLANEITDRVYQKLVFKNGYRG